MMWASATVAVITAGFSAVISGACRSDDPSERLSLSRPAFAEPLATLDGEPTTLRETIDGRYAVVSFWATWCGPCAGWQAPLRKVHAEYGEADLLRIVGIAVQSDGRAVEGHTAEHAMGWTQLLAPGGFDHPMPRRLGIHGLPEVYGFFPGGRGVELRDGADLRWFACEAAGVPTVWGIATNGLATAAEVVERYGEPQRREANAAGASTFWYARHNEHTDELVTTQLVFGENGRGIMAWWTKAEPTEPAVVLAVLPPAAQQRLDELQARLLAERGSDETIYRRFLSLHGTDRYGHETKTTLRVEEGLPEHPSLRGPHEDDWSKTRIAKLHAGRYRLVLALVPQTSDIDLYLAGYTTHPLLEVEVERGESVTIDLGAELVERTGPAAE